MAKILTLVALLFALVVCTAMECRAQTTEFTFQGNLKDGVLAANGNYDFEFALFDMLLVGNQIGSTIPKTNVLVTNGAFSVPLDFGSQFPGANRYLEIRVRLTGQQNFTTLIPRQLVNSSPYSVKSLNTDNATTATNALQLGGVAAAEYVVTTDPRMTDARPPTPGSVDYIQNRISPPQAASNVWISGNGIANGTLTGNIVTATTEFHLGSNRVLSNPGNNNFFAGPTTGQANTGQFNSFFGQLAGSLNTGGSFNSFFGTQVASQNTFGSRNTFLGTSAGGINTIGSDNTMVGYATAFGSNNLTNATALGSRAFASQSNSLILGSINGVNAATADTNVGIGTTAPSERLHVLGNGLFSGNLTINGTLNATLPAGSGNYIQNGTSQQSSSNFNISGNGAVGGNFGIGQQSPTFPLSFGSALGDKISLWSNSSNSYGFGIQGSLLQVHTDISAADIAFGYGSSGALTENMRIKGNGNVGIGTNSPSAKFHVSGGGVIRALINSDSNAGIGLGLNNQQKWSLATTPNSTLNSVGDLKLSNDFFGITTIFVDGLNNNVRIGTTTTPVTERLEVGGRIRMGDGSLATGGIEALKMVRGTVNPDGTIQAGTGFTVTHIAAGQYRVDFSGGFPSGFTPVVSIRSLGFVSISFNDQQLFVFTNNVIGVATNSGFTFIVVGPN